ncbi:MAG TPA: hypothetical protein PKC28_11215 [Bdellovibrionales bacterium]|nr:hypothetical protein [Bdellovibrionales bacterium]
MRKIIFGALGLTMLLSLVGCNEATISVRAGAVGAGIYAGSYYDYGRGWDYRRHRRGWHDGHYYWDRHDGRWIRDGRGHWRRGWDPNMVQPAQAAVEMDPATSERAVSAKYRLNARAARTLVASFNVLRSTGDLGALEHIGMSRYAIDQLARGRAPGAATVRQMADTLNADTASVNALIVDIKDEFSLQAQHGFSLK